MKGFKIILTILFLMGCILPGVAQKPSRELRYYPEGEDIVCVNGENRYTRALYGTHTPFRLETSDRPVFACWDKQKNYHFQFIVRVGNTTKKLDVTDYCEARYRGGRRTYLLQDASWGSQATLQIVALASQFEDGAVWQFTAKNFEEPLQITLITSPVRKTKMERNGDLGKEPRASFEASDVALDSVSCTVFSKSSTSRRRNRRLLYRTQRDAEQTAYFFYHHEGCKIEVALTDKAKAQMAREEKALDQLTSIISFQTPDAFINTLAPNLVAAADGLWDGETWQHGCIGWRTPLAGWRGGYVADVLGWNDRAVSHFDAYANSQVTDIPAVEKHPTQDTASNLARAVERWGTPMYSNGYICRVPNNNHKMHHYDMNLNYIDELLTHFEYDADTAYMRKMWPVLQRHLAWEKLNFDPDGDHLYDAYCCIWASDALYYNSGAVTHSSAYNYRGNALAARIAQILGEDAVPYQREAEAIHRAMCERLYDAAENHWVEFQDFMGKKRLHKSAALWSIYTPIDCGVDYKDYENTKYVDTQIPHIPIAYIIPEKYRGKIFIDWTPHTLSTTNWMPYDWSTNNVAHEEVANMALAYFQAGRRQAGFELLKSDLLDEMYLGQSPGNFGQISYYDEAVSEAYRDFGDNIGITARAVVNGLFGVQPNALAGTCTIQPGWPEEWDSLSFKSPYLSYKFRREGDKEVFEIHQHFKQPLKMQIQGKVHGVRYCVEGNRDSVQIIEISDEEKHRFAHIQSPATSAVIASSINYGTVPPAVSHRPFRMIDLSTLYNSNIDDIFKNKYLSPRSPYTTLEIPVQGIGQWCIPHRTAAIEDEGFRSSLVSDAAALKDSKTIGLGVFQAKLDDQTVDFMSAKEGKNIIYTSLWDNYPDSVEIPLTGKASCAWLLLAGSTNNMQSRIDNGEIVVTYKDGTTDILPLRNPDNWCPIEQDYFIDDYAFKVETPRPYRVHLGSGRVSRHLTDALQLHQSPQFNGANPYIPDGAAEILSMPLKSDKKLKSITIKTLSNDVVIGLISLTLQ